MCFVDYIVFTNWKFMATLCWASLSAPFFQQHLLTSFLCVAVWYFSPYFKLFRYYIFYGDQWSVIFDVTFVIVLRHHKPRPYKMANVNNTFVCFTAPPTSGSPISLPLLRFPYSLGHNIDIRPINHSMMASQCPKERKSSRSLPLNQKLKWFSSVKDECQMKIDRLKAVAPVSQIVNANDKVLK